MALDPGTVAAIVSRLSPGGGSAPAPAPNVGGGNSPAAAVIGKLLSSSQGPADVTVSTDPNVGWSDPNTINTQNPQGIEQAVLRRIFGMNSHAGTVPPREGSPEGQLLPNALNGKVMYPQTPQYPPDDTVKMSPNDHIGLSELAQRAYLEQVLRDDDPTRILRGPQLLPNVQQNAGAMDGWSGPVRMNSPANAILRRLGSGGMV